MTAAPTETALSGRFLSTKSGSNASPIPQRRQRTPRAKIRWTVPASRTWRGYEPSKAICLSQPMHAGRGAGTSRPKDAYVLTEYRHAHVIATTSSFAIVMSAAESNRPQRSSPTTPQSLLDKGAGNSRQSATYRSCWVGPFPTGQRSPSPTSQGCLSGGGRKYARVRSVGDLKVVGGPVQAGQCVRREPAGVQGDGRHHAAPIVVDRLAPRRAHDPDSARGSPRHQRGDEPLAVHEHLAADLPGEPGRG